MCGPRDLYGGIAHPAQGVCWQFDLNRVGMAWGGAGKKKVVFGVPSDGRKSERTLYSGRREKQRYGFIFQYFEQQVLSMSLCNRARAGRYRVSSTDLQNYSHTFSSQVF